MILLIFAFDSLCFGGNWGLQNELQTIFQKSIDKVQHSHQIKLSKANFSHPNLMHTLIAQTFTKMKGAKDYLNNHRDTEP